MNKKIGKFLTISLIVLTLLLPYTMVVEGEESTIASRISEISEVSVLHNSYFSEPNTTLFDINVTVEILNKEAENQTVTEISDYIPKVFINASLENQSLEFERLGYVHSTVMKYTYQPGITVEYSYVVFYINQTDLDQLPNGNYTLWRPINTAYQWLNTTKAEVLMTIITVTSGVLNITYMDFDYNPTEVTSTSFMTPIVFFLLFSLMVASNIRRKSLYNQKEVSK
ncbi:MAG: hypothetical protein KAU62_13740 [Candidatus Heimdallarchaeota archaeon]|nr:hypothetical protein [Candidatus Heimdallarchaeota archaeon]MCG3257154.1 hypothetical protein [Candidatus Heimdallarchaeota archaeon]MCK4612214.1 hypothetical protein [Candidatus Heimdallarchaeota archaeon]